MPVQAKASFWFLICAFLQRGISAITTPIFTRLMTTFEYGQYSVFTSWMSIAACFITLNIYGGVYVQGLVKFENQREQFASSFQGLNLSLTVIWLGIYILFSGKWNQLLGLTFGQGLLMLLLIWTTGVFQLWAQEQRVSFRYKALLLATLAYSLLAPILGVIFIKISLDKVTARIIGLAAASIAAYGWMFIVQCRKGKIFCSLELWKYALKLVIPLIPHYLSQMILNSSDRIMISRIVGDREAGIYSLAYSISLIMTMFNTSLLSTIEPWIYQRIREREVDKIKRVAYPSFVLIAMVNLLLIVFAPEIIGIFAPNEYYEAIWVIPPIAMSVFFMFAYSFFAMFEFYFEQTKYITIATFTGALVNIITNYIFIQKFGYIAAGYTTLMCYIIYAVLHFLFMKKICKEKLDGIKVYDLRVISGITVLFMVLGFAMIITYRHLMVRYLVVGIGISGIIIVRHKLIHFIKVLFETRTSKKS